MITTESMAVGHLRNDLRMSDANRIGISINGKRFFNVNIDSRTAVYRSACQFVAAHYGGDLVIADIRSPGKNATALFVAAQVMADTTMVVGSTLVPHRHPLKSGHCEWSITTGHAARRLLQSVDGDLDRAKVALTTHTCQFAGRKREELDWAKDGSLYTIGTGLLMIWNWEAHTAWPVLATCIRMDRLDRHIDKIGYLHGKDIVGVYSTCLARQMKGLVPAKMDAAKWLDAITENALEKV